MCYCDNYEMPSMYESGTHTARKQHQCYECARVIQPGERYENVVGVWDGEFSVYKTCSFCLDLRNFVQGKIECLCWSHGSIREDAIETARNHSEIPGVLFGVWRREVKIRRAKSSLKMKA